MNVEGQEQQGYKQEYYTGFASFNVVAINPTYAQAKELGLYVKEGEDFIDYTIKDKEDPSKIIGINIIAHVLHKDEAQNIFIKSRTRYRITMQDSYSAKTGKYQYCNHSGKTDWKPSVDELDEQFTAAGNVRVCLMGERNFLEFMRCFFDIRGNSACNIPKKDYEEKFFKNDFSKLHALVKGYPKNKVKFLCGINTYTNNDGEIKQSQGIVDSIPLRTYANLNQNLEKSINYYLENTQADYLLDIGSYPYILGIWKPVALDTPTDIEGGATDTPGEAAPW